MVLSDLRWRDRLVASVAWASSVLAAARYWAVTAYGKPFIPGIGQPSSPDSNVALLATLLLGVTMLAPVGLLAITKTRYGRQVVEGLLRAVMSSESFFLLLLILGVCTLILIFPAGTVAEAARSLAFAVAAWMGFWLAYRRERVDLKLVGFAVAWAFMIALTGQALQMVSGRIDFAASSWRAKVYISVIVIGLLTLLVMPLAGLVTRARESMTRMLTFAVRLPVGVYATGTILMGGCLLAYEFATPDNVALNLGIKLVQIALVVCVAGLVGQATTVSKVDSEEPAVRSVPAWFQIGLLAAGALYLALAVPSSISQRYTLNPDTIDYLLIARKYAMGDIVVRGYWSPLISWLLAVPIRLGYDPQVSLRTLGVVLGAMWLVVCDQLAARCGLSYKARLAFDFALALLALAIAFEAATADLLGGTFVAIFVYWMSHPGLSRHPIRYGALAGLTAALAYYGKYYNLTFVIPFVIFAAAMLILHGRDRRKTLAAAIIALAVTAICVVPWVTAIHSRYGQWTVSTSAGINRAFTSPHFKGMIVALSDQPPDLLIPSEDPQPWAYPGRDWSPFVSLDDFRAQVGLVFSNIWAWAGLLSANLSPLPLLGLLFVVISLFSRWTRESHRLRDGGLVMGVMLYVAAYMLTWSGGFRYYVALFPAFLIAVFLASDYLLLHGRVVRDRLSRFAVSAIFLVGPVLSLNQLPVVLGQATSHADPCMADGSHAVGPLMVEPIAGLEKSNSELAYYTWKRTLGFLPWTMPAADVDAALRSLHVRTFVIPANSDKVETLTQSYGYTLVAQPRLCHRFFSVLRVPQN